MSADQRAEGGNRSAFTRKDEAHYIVYRRLTLDGIPHDRAYKLASAAIEDLTTGGLTVTKRSEHPGRGPVPSGGDPE